MRRNLLIDDDTIEYGVTTPLTGGATGLSLHEIYASGHDLVNEEQVRLVSTMVVGLHPPELTDHDFELAGELGDNSFAGLLDDKLRWHPLLGLDNGASLLVLARVFFIPSEVNPGFAAGVLALGLRELSWRYPVAVVVAPPAGSTPAELVSTLGFAPFDDGLLAAHLNPARLLAIAETQMGW